MRMRAERDEYRENGGSIFSRDMQASIHEVVRTIVECSISFMRKSVVLLSKKG